MKKPVFFLTHRAALDLEKIFQNSEQRWGKKKADDYVATLYQIMKQTADQPLKGTKRLHRSAPFLMMPAGQHFIGYDVMKAGIIIRGHSSPTSRHRKYNCAVNAAIFCRYKKVA